MTPNGRDNNICKICAVLVGWGTSVVLLVSMKMGDTYSLVQYTHITINFIGMKMGEAPDPTINQPTTHITTSNDRTYDVYDTCKLLIEWSTSFLKWGDI